MKRVLICSVILVLIVLVITGCDKQSNPLLTGFDGEMDVELLMPGNTVVIGTCTEIVRPSSGWVKLKVNGTWYACNEWRVVIKERKRNE